MAAPPDALAAGSVFADRYQVIEELGRGGMGSVYRVFDRKLKEEVALKLIKPEVASDRDTIERFGNELRLARKIGHRNVGRMYELMDAGDAHFITMEYVPGEDLKSFIRRAAPLSIGKSVEIARQVCEGLTEAHRLGVIHRDLKPSNIMIDKEGNARIMDFGIARSLKVKGITGAGVMIGTPEYMSPEQAEAKEVDQRSDIYSLGVILFEMLTGRVPFEGDTPLSVAIKHKTEPAPDPRKLNPQIPDGLTQLILRSMEKDRARRYQSADEVLAGLGKIESGIPPTAREIPKRKPFTSKEITIKFSLRRVLWPALIIIGLIVAGLAVWKYVLKKPIPLLPEQMRSIAIISFENQTGDQAYDYLSKVIPNLLITKLEQSGYFNVTTWERIYDLLKQVGKPDAEFIGRDLGFELCQKDGVEIIVLGSVTKAGNTFVTDAKVLEVGAKKLLSTANSRGDSPDSILKNQVDDLSRQIATGVGLSQRKFAAATKRIGELTTSSVEAYRYFLMGLEETDKNHPNSRPYFEKAVEIDPNFAMALAALGGESLKKALALSKNVSEKERLFIEASYASTIERDRAKAMAICKRITDKYPKEKRAYYALGNYSYAQVNLPEAIGYYLKAVEIDPSYVMAWTQMAYAYFDLNEKEKGLDAFQRAASARPDYAQSLDSLAEGYFKVGRLDDSIVFYNKALQADPGFFPSMAYLGYVHALKEEYSEAVRWTGNFLAAVAPEYKVRGYLLQALYLFILGRTEKSLSHIQMAVELADSLKSNVYRAYADWLKAWIYYDLGDIERSRAENDGAFSALAKLASTVGSANVNITQYEINHRYLDGLIELEQKNAVRAKSRLEEMTSGSKNLTDLLQPGRRARFETAWLRAMIALTENSFDGVTKALGDAEGTNCVPHSGWVDLRSWIRYNTPFQRDALARAYAERGDTDKALEAYEKLITFDPKSPSRVLINPLYHYRLGMLYEEKGIKDKAKLQYERFLDLWKDADSDRPEPADARKRLDSLQK